MPFPKIMGGKQSPFYSSLASSDSESVSEEPKSYRPPSQKRIPTLYLPIIFTGIFLSGILLGQVVNSSIGKQRISSEADPQSSHVESFVPNFPLKTVVFEEIEPLVAVPDPENQKYWDALVPPGHGFVNVTDPQKYNLEPGITTPSGTDRYSIAMFHQLHCLGLMRHHYFALLDATKEGWSQDERNAVRKSQLADRHSQHCIGYIAQSILCNADTTLEWAKVEADGSRIHVNGYGIPHQCKNPEMIWDWMVRNQGPVKPPGTHLSD